MIDEGCVKFDCRWLEEGPLPEAEIGELIEWRNRLCAAGLIGHDNANDVGFGNISCRAPGAREFVISATQTGHVPIATAREFTRVVDYDIAANRVVCRGPARASSESLTHAAIYDLDPDYGSVVHVHNRALWQSLLGRIPTTDADVAYGTPAMAAEFGRLHHDGDLRVARMAAMGGHEHGLISIGQSVAEAAERVLHSRGRTSVST